MRVAAGTSWDEIDAVTSPLGLATPGDIGHLTRRFGLAFDNLLEADVVFADGRVLRAAPDEHPGLYWALRGGAEIGHVTSVAVPAAQGRAASSAARRTGRSSTRTPSCAPTASSSPPPRAR